MIKKKNSKIFLIIIILIILTISGFLIYDYSIKNKQDRTTYKNDTFGIEFNYPSSMHLTSDQFVDLISISVDNNNSYDFQMIFIGNIVWNDNAKIFYGGYYQTINCLLNEKDLSQYDLTLKDVRIINGNRFYHYAPNISMSLCAKNGCSYQDLFRIPYKSSCYEVLLLKHFNYIDYLKDKETLSNNLKKIPKDFDNIINSIKIYK